jgi:hypothetical protein
MNHPLPRNELSAPDDDTEAAPAKTVPSWLTQNYRDDDAEFLVNQYRRKQEEPLSATPPENRTYEYYRRRIMDRQREQVDVQMDRSPMPQVPQRPMIPANDVEVQHRYYGSERDMGDEPVSYAASGYDRPKLKKSLLFAGLFAAVAGGTIGFAVTKYDQVSQTASDAYAFAASLLPGQPDPVFEANRQTDISKKPIAIASLDVSDVSGNLNSMIPLALNAEPAFANQELAIKISGLPASAYLTAGKKLSDNTWILKDGEEDGINLFVPQSDRSKFDISVAAIETNTGELAAPVKEMTVAIDDAKLATNTNLTADEPLQITPASAPPETSVVVKKAAASVQASTAPVQVPADLETTKPALSAEVTGLLGKGDMLMKTGDLIIARQFYKRAFEMGAAEGALGIARTYDPSVFTELKVQGITPDVAKATEWYEKAKAAGVAEADVALTSLAAATPQ